LGIIPLAAGVVTTLRTSAKNSVRELIDYTAYMVGYKLQKFTKVSKLNVDKWPMYKQTHIYSDSNII